MLLKEPQEDTCLGSRLLGLEVQVFNIGSLTIRIGFWGPLYYMYKEPPQHSIGKY